MDSAYSRLSRWVRSHARSALHFPYVTVVSVTRTFLAVTKRELKHHTVNVHRILPWAFSRTSRLHNFVCGNNLVAVSRRIAVVEACPGAENQWNELCAGMGIEQVKPCRRFLLGERVEVSRQEGWVARP